MQLISSRRFARIVGLSFSIIVLGACGGDGVLAPPLEPLGVYDLQTIDGEGPPFATFQSIGDLDGEEVLILTERYAVTLELRAGGTFVRQPHIREFAFDPVTGQLLSEQTRTLAGTGGVWSLNGNLVNLEWDEDVAGCTTDVFTLSADSRRLSGSHCNSTSLYLYAKR